MKESMFPDMTDTEFLDMMDLMSSFMAGGKNQAGGAGPKKPSPGTAS